MIQWIQDRQITSGMKVAEMVWEVSPCRLNISIVVFICQSVVIFLAHANKCKQLGHCENPPLRLLLGQYAIECMRDKLRFTLEEIEDWKHISQIDTGEDAFQRTNSGGQDDDMMEGDGD